MIQKLLKTAEKKNPKVRRAMHVAALVIAAAVWLRNRKTARSEAAEAE